MESVFNSFDRDHSSPMEYQECSDAIAKIGYVFSPQIVSLMVNNLDGNHGGYSGLNGFIRALSIIQLVLVKMQPYDPKFTGSVTLNVNQMMDVVFHSHAVFL